MLTDSAIRKAKPKDCPYKLPRELGLFLLVNPNGAKWWRFTYTHEGKEKLLSLGVYPDVTLAQARKRRDVYRELLAQGIDPSEHKREERAAKAAAALNSLSAVVESWKAAELVANSDEYQRNVARMLERDVLPYLGDRPLAEIKTRELITVFDRIRSRGVDARARRARTIVGQVFRYAIRRGLAEYDPTQALRGERRSKPAGHFAAFTDPADVAQLMRAIYDYRGTPEVRAALKLSALLFQRPGEIRTTQWSQIDLEAASARTRSCSCR